MFTLAMRRHQPSRLLVSGPATGELVVDREMLILPEISKSCLAGLGNSLLDVEVGIRKKVLP